jgi:bacterioferritin
MGPTVKSVEPLVKGEITMSVKTSRAPAARDGNHSKTSHDEGAAETSFTRQDLIELLNEDLAREYQAIIAYVNYSQVIKGAAYMKIAQELEVHAAEELSHALQISKQIDYLGGMPVVVPKTVETSKVAEDMLRFDLYNEVETIANYRVRIHQAEALNEYALAEVLRDIIMQEQDHAIELATALGMDVPHIPDFEAGETMPQ